MIDINKDNYEQPHEVSIDQIDHGSDQSVLLPSMQENTRTDILTVAGDAMHKAPSLNEALQPYMGPFSANEYSPALAA